MFSLELCSAGIQKQAFKSAKSTAMVGNHMRTDRSDMLLPLLLPFENGLVILVAMVEEFEEDLPSW